MCYNQRAVLFLLIFLFLIGVTHLKSQNLDTLEVPKDTLNYRYNDQNDNYGNDFYGVIRPALSIQGFDSKGREGDSNEGLGLKQILIKVYDEQIGVYIDIHEKLLTISDKSLESAVDNSDDEINYGILVDNSQIMQARAYEALVTYVLEKNNYSLDALNDVIDSDLHDHSIAMDSLTNGLINPPGCICTPRKMMPKTMELNILGR